MTEALIIPAMVCAGVLVLGVATHRAFSIKGPWGNISVGSGAGKDRCAACRGRVVDAMDAMWAVRIDLRAAQNKHSENAMLRLAGHLADQFELKMRLCCPASDSVIVHFDRFNAKVKECMWSKILPGLRQVYRENHIAEKSAQEWSTHKNGIVLTVRAEVMAFARDEWLPVPGMGKEIFLDFLADQWPAIERELYATLDNARTSAIAAQKRVEELSREVRS
jgi:hypothetical protein